MLLCVLFIHSEYRKKSDYKCTIFTTITPLKVGCVLHTWTDQPASFPEAINETRVQHAGQLIALDQVTSSVVDFSCCCLTLTVCTRQVSTATLAHLTFYVPVWQPPIWTEMRMSQLMPLPLTVSCFSKIQFGFTFLVPGQRAIQQVCMLPFFNILFQHQEKSSCKPIKINTRYFT